MTAYVQSSIRYRPKFFRDILGQKAVIKVLQNSLRLNQISSAYILSGQRGTGKTSLARVFAKAINCHAPQDTEPCGECSSCFNIDNCKDPNVLELDSASHGLKEDIAELHKLAVQVPYPGMKKIFILDECHALSKAGQNAFLKILEEPPKDVIFFLVTTEPNKLEDTILSRCFQLSFRAIPIPEIEKSLRRIFSESGFPVSDRVINTVLNNSEGSLRDIQQVADQAVSLLSGGELDDDELIEMLGYLSIDRFKEVAYLLCSRDFGVWVEGMKEMWHSGVDLEYVLGSALQLLLRDFRCSKVCGEDWDYVSGIPYASFKKNMPFSEIELDALQRALEDALDQKFKGAQTRLCLEMFYAKFLDEMSFLEQE